MPRVAPHHHPCQDCGAKVECSGTWEENYDGEPPVICPEWHLKNGEINADFVCGECFTKRETVDVAERRSYFHAHLGVCEQCRNHPFDLCPVGAVLLQQSI